MMTFQRARSEEQRAVRRRAILDAAAAMLAEMPVAQVSLNELSRRAGLAKSNVLRYFESREAVLLELLDAAWQEWLAAVDLPRSSCDDVAGELATSLAARPVLCDLIGAQAAVLERNVSPTVAATYKHAAVANASALGDLVLAAVPRLGRHDAQRFAAAAVMSTGAVWTHSQPSAAMLAAYEAEPELAAMRLDFCATLTELFAVLLAGLLARSSS